MSATHFRTIDSPVGLLTLAGRDNTLNHLRMVGQAHEPNRAGWELNDDAFPDAVEQLAAYFAGELTAFDLELELAGTGFQRRVWAALQTIPYGETRTYGQLAEQLGNPSASRAVGRANATNPIAVIVPCHRVIGKSGDLTGYHWGVTRKRAMLGWESGQVMAA